MSISERNTSDRPIQVLLVDDEQSIIDLIEMGLRYEGFEVRSVLNGYAALEMLGVWKPRLVILDANLPDLDGFEVCRYIRRDRNDVLIIMLTVRDDLADKVRGFDLGADDYLTKPFHFPELLARMRAVLRRHLPPVSDIFTLGNIILNLKTREVCLDGVPIELTRKEFNLLHLFMQYPNLVLERQTILDRVWGYDYYGDTTIIEVYISNLRSKLSSESLFVIRTVRGIGYMLRIGGE